MNWRFQEEDYCGVELKPQDKPRIAFGAIDWVSAIECELLCLVHDVLAT
jgi:hypothetical protein